MITNAPGSLLHTFPRDYCVFDLETTGCSCSFDQVIEISAVKVLHGSVADSFSTLVDPKRPIPPQASAVNNISDSMVRGKPTIDKALADFAAFAGDLPLIGHNICSFDLKFINRDAEKYLGGVFGNDYIDTLPLARRLVKELSHHKLTDLAAYYGIGTDGAHRALNDCLMNQQIYEKLAATAAKIPACPECGAPMVKRSSRFGEFWGCSAYPDCRGVRKM